MTGTRLVFPLLGLEDVPFLKGRQLKFNSVAEMFYTRAQETPNAPHVLFYEDVITYAQTNQCSNQVANYLKEKGVQKGDVVSVLVSNSPEFYYTMFGAQKLGGIAGAINYMLKGPEIANILDDSKPKVVFVSSEYMKGFAAGYALATHKPIIVEVATGIEHGVNIIDCQLVDILNKYPDSETLESQSLDDPFLLLYSSGTTGNPKGILSSNRAQLTLCEDVSRSQLYQGNDVMMNIMPMFHTNPICVWSYPLIYAGQTICIRKGFSPTDFWPSILQYEVTLLMGVPAMYAYVYSSIDPSAIDWSRFKLRGAMCGAAPLSVQLIEGFKEKFNVDIVEGYGLTEVIGISTVNPPAGKKKPGSIGMGLPSQRVEIMDDDNNIIAVGERGEICTAGDCNMIGYLNRPAETEDTIKDGWLHTGDIGYMDEEGYFYIVDRKKEMINRGGENIYPREIEIAIEGYPKVAEVAVIGVHDSALGERVKAFIVPKADVTLTGDEIQEFLEDKIAKYKIPEFIDITNNIPRTPTGKILKKELKKMEETKNHNH